jgi:hypothetical protein
MSIAELNPTPQQLRQIASMSYKLGIQEFSLNNVVRSSSWHSNQEKKKSPLLDK